MKKLRISLCIASVVIALGLTFSTRLMAARSPVPGYEFVASGTPVCQFREDGECNDEGQRECTYGQQNVILRENDTHPTCGTNLWKI